MGSSSFSGAFNASNREHRYLLSINPLFQNVKQREHSSMRMTCALNGGIATKELPRELRIGDIITCGPTHPSGPSVVSQVEAPRLCILIPPADNLRLYQTVRHFFKQIGSERATRW